MIRDKIKVLALLTFAIFFKADAHNYRGGNVESDFKPTKFVSFWNKGIQSNRDVVKNVSLSQNGDLYKLEIKFTDRVAFIPRIHLQPVGLRIFLSFKKPVILPKIGKKDQGIVQGYFFEKFGKSSLMFIMSTKQPVNFIEKKYTKDSIKIVFEKKPTIVIDAGHGGKDPGTQSPYEKYFEKDITLTTAIELRNALLRAKHYNVVLTRDSDEFISLDDRSNLANSCCGDLFISLHADFNNDKSLRGMSIYTLPRLEVLKPTGIFFENLKKSEKFAQQLMKYIPYSCQIPKEARRVGDLKILRNNMPSILIEMGCISNKKDSKLLISKLFREKVICAILYALEEFFDEERDNLKRTVVR